MPRSFSFPNSPYSVTVNDDLDINALSNILDGVLDDLDGVSLEDCQENPIGFLDTCGISIDDDVIQHAGKMTISDIMHNPELANHDEAWVHIVVAVVVFAVPTSTEMDPGSDMGPGRLEAIRRETRRDKL